jgi:phospho-N-acetylmuramoyl-pentapeptide-transferase
MLYNLLTPLAEDYIIFNLFRYQTFRTAGAVLTAFVIGLAIAPRMIVWLKKKQREGQPIRADGPESHHGKSGTPTMGGFMILISVTIATLLWADLSNLYIWMALLVMVGFGAIGFCDDYLKLTRKNTKGLAGKIKLVVQIVIGLIATGGIVYALPDAIQTGVALPFFKDLYIPLSWGFFAWALLVMIGAANAVNLTDGLDGLAIVPVAIVAASFGLISYLVGRVDYSSYLHLSHVAGTGELAVICGALIGGAMAFLWFNCPPAKIFMGDTGSLSMGGVLGAIAIMTKHELVLVITGGLFVMETLSVIIQVASYRLTGKRVFAMAPIHHHFEQKGWPETTVVIRFWIIAIVFAIIGLSTLKLR